MRTRERADLNLAGELAAAEGWNGEAVVGDRASVIKMDLRRGDERLSLTAWTSNGEIHCAHGSLATGQISSQPVQRSWNSYVDMDELTGWMCGKPREAYTNNSGFELLVAEGEVHRSWETACNYTAHQTVPGRYPLELQTIGWQRIAEGDACNISHRAYYVATRVPTIELRRHYVNRVFTASSVHDEQVNRPSTISWDCYAYQLPEAGEVKTMGELFTIVPAE